MNWKYLQNAYYSSDYNFYIPVYHLKMLIPKYLKLWFLPLPLYGCETWSHALREELKIEDVFWKSAKWNTWA
jgi:hypothetical protein